MAEICDIPKTEKGVVEFLQSKGVLPSQKICVNGHQMTLHMSPNPQWQCNISTCRSRIALRKGTWFEGCRLSFVTAIRIIYLWSKNQLTTQSGINDLDLNMSTFVVWKQYLREACKESLLSRPSCKIGGPGKIVEVDETLFAKRKNNQGRILPQQWLLGGLCRETKECFLVAIPGRTASVLLDAIKQHIAPGSSIYSDCCKAYENGELNAADYQHLKVNHTYNFVDPSTEADTQNAERLWGLVNWRNKRDGWTNPHHLQSYLAEFIWRRLHHDEDVFDAMLQAISIPSAGTVQRTEQDRRKPYYCSSCDFKTSCKNYLKNHESLHTDEKPYQCNLFECKSSCKTPLISYKKIPFCCIRCGYKTFHKGHFKRHEKIHIKKKFRINRKLFECQLCDYKSPIKSNWQSHENNHFDRFYNLVIHINLP